MFTVEMVKGSKGWRFSLGAGFIAIGGVLLVWLLGMISLAILLSFVL